MMVPATQAIITPGFAATTNTPLGLGLVSLPQGSTQRAPPPTTPGKRKADDTQDNNERLSKRLSRLKLERNRPRLRILDEAPSAPSPVPEQPRPTDSPSRDAMQLDDSKHRVYIHSLEDELTSESDDDHEGRLVFLPGVERHLRESRIPPHVLASPDGQLAGMQLVLYSDPKSLSVPEERDGVRRAILDARHRARERQRLEREGPCPVVASGASPSGHDDEMDLD